MIFELFPTPVSIVKNFLTEEEKEEILSSKIPEYENEFNKHLKHTQTLEDSFMPNMRKRIITHVSELGFQLFGEDLNWKITGLWKNEMKKDGYQYKHNHQNSFISGIIYVKFPDGSPNTQFYRPQQENTYIFSNQNRKAESTKYNYEWASFEGAIQESSMILFPSYIKHSVGTMETDDTRVSIAFNCVPSKMDDGVYRLSFDV